jgi:hypothetical protein
MEGRPVYLRGKPQLTLSNVHEGEFVHRVGHGAGGLDVPVRPRSELISGHLTPRFMVTPSRSPLNGERGGLLKCSRWSSKNGALKIRGIPGPGGGSLRVGPGIWPDGWCVPPQGWID